ncbi:phosphotransferase family protein [Endozoicomonas sp. G2_2]|uniref:phosphotransferase family protein n=1 Tax=Endozoicomonas sp. G2_2 TaxID=2821092 RepID=UPI001AD973F0|nr:phosphotransferase family protein [Endozoicomonas sp. G2_2]MBO9468815.1 phosphotransferase family protein [Endozoicomonas sp. G2_2]
MASDANAGAPEIVAVREAHRLDRAALESYLSDHGLLDGGLEVSQFQGGQSNPTYFLTTGSADAPTHYVLRKQPPGQILPSAHRIDREYRVMSALADAPGVPVPRMHVHCEDADVIGTPFYVMDYIPGRVFGDPALPELAAADRGGVYHSLVDTLAALHRVDVDAVGLSDFGRPSGYVERQIKRWRGQYEASATETDPAMDALGQWLTDHIPADTTPAIAHGDFRIGNLLLAPDSTSVAAVLDWELATIGHPIADLAYACMPYHLPYGVKGVRGIEGLDLAAHGIPGESSQLARYCEQRGIGDIDDWPVFVAFSLFRTAAILQGVYARALQGNASNSDALDVGRRAGLIAERGWAVARAHD